MFNCKSYLKLPRELIKDLTNINENWQEYFIDMSDMSLMKRISKDIDTDYVEGAIYIKYINDVLIDFTYWDLIDQLWGYILNMIEEFIENDYASSYFPDQPVLLEFKSISEDYILFNIDNRKYILPKKSFLNILLNSSENFFKGMKEVFYKNPGLYKLELEQIDNIKIKLSLK